MCDSCIRRIRFDTALIGRRQIGTRPGGPGSEIRGLPAWLTHQACQYITSLRYPLNASAVRFGRQIIWTDVRTRRGGQERSPYLVDMQAFEYFSTDRAYYDRVFTVRRSQPGILGRIRDFLTQDDEIWEALYLSYQAMNSDMRTLVYLRHQSPSSARGFLARLDENLYRQIMGALLSVTTSYIAPLTGRAGLGVINQASQQIARILGYNTSLKDAILAWGNSTAGRWRAP